MGLVNTGIKTTPCVQCNILLYFWCSGPIFLLEVLVILLTHDIMDSIKHQQIKINRWLTLLEILYWAKFGSSNRTIIQTQTSKTTQKWVTEYKTKLLLWPFQSSDLNPAENEWVNWREEAPSWRCASEGSGVILDEGMISDLFSGVL